MASNKKFWFLLTPILIFIVIGYFLWVGLYTNPRAIPSPLQNKPAPAFNGQSLQNPQQIMTAAVFQGHVTILNVFATWCVACRAEHSVWIEARHDLQQTKIIGLNLKDQRDKVLEWLNRYGNPYDQIIFDPSGDIAINFGVYGTPETFIIDKHGIIRYKFIGAVSPTDWEKTLFPEIKKWQKQN